MDFVSVFPGFYKFLMGCICLAAYFIYLAEVLQHFFMSFLCLVR